MTLEEKPVRLSALEAVRAAVPEWTADQLAHLHRLVESGEVDVLQNPSGWIRWIYNTPEARALLSVPNP